MEELYDLKDDPNEWRNLANQRGFEGVKRRLADWMPKNNARPLPGSKARLVEIRNGKVYWEGEPIVAAEKRR